MNKKYEVRLEPKEREWIEQLLHADSTSPGIRRRCLVLMLSDESQGAIPKQAEIAPALGGQRCHGLLHSKRLLYPRTSRDTELPQAG
ncbi:hypothetical protein D3C74_150720 [compost metagenome]